MEETEQGKSVVKECCRCEELESKCVELEAEIEKSRIEYETLAAKFKEIEAELATRNAIENELDGLREAGNAVGPPHRPEDGWQSGSNIVWYFDSGEGHDGDGDGNVVRGEGQNGHGNVEGVEGQEHMLRSAESEEDEESEVKIDNVEMFQLMVDNDLRECLKGEADHQAELLKHNKLRGTYTSVAPPPRFTNDVAAVEIGEGSGDQPSAETTNNDLASKHIKGEEEGLNVESKVEDETPNSDPTSKHIKGEVEGFNVESKVEYETRDNNLASKRIKGEEKGFNMESKVEYAGQVRKHLTTEDQSPSKKMAPLTPSLSRTPIILIGDSDDEHEVAYVEVTEGIMDDEKEMISEGSMERALLQQSDEESMVDFKDNILFGSTPKRKRASNIVTSDSEKDFEDDNNPISEVEKMHFEEIIPDQVCSEMNWCSVTATPAGCENISNHASPQKRRLIPLRELLEKSEAGKSSSSNTSETKCEQGIPTTEDVEDDGSEKTGSDSEGESLNGFIVNSTEESDSVDDPSDAPDESDDNVDFNGILSGLRRSKDRKIEWEFEADMLAGFGKDPELCMKAVCALYRQQTQEEKVTKGSLVYNSRGFSKIDAHRGTTLAEFLTDGHPQGDLKKSVKDLQEYDPNGIETCRTFATCYSKQLFEIYKNKEDALFLPA